MTSPFPPLVVGVRRAKIEQSPSGSIALKFECPKCQTRLHSDFPLAKEASVCPACESQYVFDAAAMDGVVREEIAKAKRLKQEEQAKAERLQKEEQFKAKRFQQEQLAREHQLQQQEAAEANRAAKEQAIASEASHKDARIASSCEEQAEKSYESLSTILMISRIGVPLAIFLFAMNGGSQNPFLLIGLGIVWEVFFHVVSFFVHALMSCQMLMKQIRRHI